MYEKGKERNEAEWVANDNIWEEILSALYAHFRKVVAMHSRADDSASHHLPLP